MITLSGQSGTAGSVRSGASSKAVGAGASLKEVLDAGDWSTETVFKQFYFKPEPIKFY